MFRALLCPSLGARDYNVYYHIGRIVLGLLCVGGKVQLGWSSVRVAAYSLQPGHYSTCLNNLACKSHFYRKIRLYHTSSTLPHEGAVLNKRLLNTKCIFCFSLQYCLKRFSF